MKGKSLNSKDYAKIREMVATSNQKSLQSLLGFPSRKYIADGDSNPNIHPSNKKASVLLYCFCDKLSRDADKEDTERGEKCNLDVDEILQALLMIDPVYVTPWNALVSFASALADDSVPVVPLIQCVSSIEEFLFKAKFTFTPSKSCLDEELFPNTIRELIVQFVEKLRDSLLLNPVQESKSSQSNEFLDKKRNPMVIQLSTQLLYTVLTACKNWSNGVFNCIARVAFFRRPSTPRIKFWLHLTKRLIICLTRTQVEEIGIIFLDLLRDDSIKISQSQDWAPILSCAIDIARTLDSAPALSSDKESSMTAPQLWRRSTFVGLYKILTQNDQQCYLQSERCLREGIEQLNTDSVKVWISEIIVVSSQSTNTAGKALIPEWFGVNLVSLCIEVLRDKEIASNLPLLDKVASTDVVDGKNNSNSLSGDEYKSIVDFLEGGEGIMAPQFRKVIYFAEEELCEKDADMVFYRNGGLFYLENDGSEILNCLSKWGSKILKSLLMKSCESRGFVKKDESIVLPRAIRLVNMVDYILKNCPDDCLSITKSFAVVAKTVAYFEVPECRTILEEKIEHDLSKPSRFQTTQFSALRIIAYSALKKDSNSDMARRWYGIFERIVPLSQIKDLHLLRSIIPIAGSGILSISKKLLEPLYSSWGTHQYENEAKEEMSEPQSHQRIIFGLRVLLELIGRDQWGQNETDAWMILSDLIVGNPPLPQECRRWLFGTLTSSVSNGNFHDKAADRILRASTTKMSSFFIDYEMESKIMATTKQIEEIRSLHRLMTILFQHIATENGYDEYQLYLARGREIFLRAVLLYKKGQLVGNQFHHIISKQYCSLRMRGSGCFFPCWFVFLKINLYLLDSIMSEGSKIKTFGHLENSSMNDKTSLDDLVRKIKEAEKADLVADGGNDSFDASWCPVWQQSEIMGDHIEVFPCLDLLIEFLFLVPLPARESLDLDDPLSWKVITASGFLIRRKDISAKSIESVLSTDTIKKTADFFLSTSSFLFRGAIDIDCGISALDDLLAPIVSYCRALHLTFEANEFADYARIVGNLWNLYQAVGSERACVRIINYLESHASKKHDVPRKREHGFYSLGSISTESEIDETMRQLRFSCLQPFLSCLSALSSLPPEEVYNTSRTTSLTRSLTGGILGALVADLRAGLNGKSGGIPRNLYILYCMCIEECGSLLYHLRHVDFDSSVFHLFRSVTSTLADVLVTVPLRDAVLFRTTFILAVAVFPSMNRDLVRRCLCDADESKPPRTVGNMLLDDSALFEKVLDDCIDILMRWAALREPCMVPWLDIAGPDHSEGMSDAAISRTDYDGPPNNFDSDQEVDWEIPRVVHVPSPPRNRRTLDSGPNRIPWKIRLCTKELWSWALSCSLLGLEQNWLESERTIQVVETDDRLEDSLEEWKKLFVARTKGWVDFFCARTTKLQNSLLQLNRFFGASQGLQQHDSRGNHIVLDMMVMNLPSAPRLRFCCLIECISRVLVLSIRQLCLFLREELRNCQQDLSVFESVSCLSAWLCLGDDPEKDFSVGVFKWLAIASRKNPPGEILSTGKKEDKAELFERVSMVSGQVHDLYLELKELQKVLRKRGADSLVAKELLGRFAKGGDSVTNEMLRCSKLKLHALEQVIPSEFKAKSLPDFPSSGIASLSKKRAPSKSRRQPSGLKKRKVQSSRKNRNKVVDIFMNLDQGTDGSRRNNTRDAYADLEDFLVEG